MKHVAVKIASDGEILISGQSVMQGYYQNDAATNEIIRDGWLYTGDIGTVDRDGFLAVTGRKKDVIVTSGGKNISPQKIENLVLADPIFNQIVVVGDGYHFLTALIVPHFERLKTELRAGRFLSGENVEELVKLPAAHQIISLHLAAQTKELAQYEKIQYFTLLCREFSHEKGELTLTLKTKRQVICERYRDNIAKVYQEAQHPQHKGSERLFYVI
jgi:long-chain acyl-CoA synthetase